MNSLEFDPDLKIYMSLDEIIKLTKSEINSQLCRGFTAKKNKKKRKKRNAAQTDNHSVPLITSSGRGCIYVTKNSPLLTAEWKRKIEDKIYNRIVNADLLQKTKKIIPATYKLVQSETGLTRVLVPAKGYILNSHKYPVEFTDTPVNNCNNNSVNCLPKIQFDTPFQTPSHSQTCGISNRNLFFDDNLHMEVDEPDDEVVVLGSGSKFKSKPVVIDVESNSQVNISDTNEMSNLGHEKLKKTLNERFTMLLTSNP